MQISQKIPPRKSLLSIEFFPPKTPEGLQNLKNRLINYNTYQPDFMSVTYGAGGGTQQTTKDIATFIHQEVKVSTMAHISCVGHSVEQLDEMLLYYKKIGIENIMVIRGDPPQGQTSFQTPENGFAHASDLITHIKKNYNFCVGCAGYPEGHLESPNTDTDCRYLKLKIDSGADFIVSQFFLDNSYFLRFRDRLLANRLTIPLFAGILPISNFTQISRFSMGSGVTIPAKVMKGLYNKTDEEQEKFGLDHASEQIEQLLNERVDGIHLYALNKKNAVERLAPLVRERYNMIK